MTDSYIQYHNTIIKLHMCMYQIITFLLATLKCEYQSRKIIDIRIVDIRILKISEIKTSLSHFSLNFVEHRR